MQTSPYLIPGANDELSATTERRSPLLQQTVLSLVTPPRGVKTVTSVTLVAPLDPVDVLGVRNELARLEAQGGGSSLDDAATLFGGTVNLDFHQRNTSLKLQKQKQIELEVYGHLAFASAMRHPLLIVGATSRTYIHFATVAYIVQESELGVACQFSLILYNKHEYKFICNSSAEYLQWIDCLQRAYKASHPPSTHHLFQRQQQHFQPYAYQQQNYRQQSINDFDDRRSISSQNSMNRRPQPRQQQQQRTPTPSNQSQFRSSSRSSSYGQSPSSYYQSNNNTLNSHRSMPIISQQQQQYQHQQQRQQRQQYQRESPSYYETEFDYTQNQSRTPPSRGRSVTMPSQKSNFNKSKSVDRFYRSTRPTNLGLDNDLYSDDDGNDSASSLPRGIQGNSNNQQKQHPQRSMSAPRMGPSKSPEMNMQELYELTVNAYKAGLADEFLDNDERDVRDRGRFNNRNHSVDSPVRVNGGYPTRSGSVVRFSGEDEVAYDLQRMSSDGSNTSGSRRSNSSPRYHSDENEDVEDEEKDDYEEEDGDDEQLSYQNRRQMQLQQHQHQQQQEQYQQAAMASRQTSTPMMMQKSVTVDGRYGKGSKPTIVIPPSVEQQMLKSRRNDFDKELGLVSSSPTKSSHRSKSVDPRLMDGSNGSNNKRSTLSPTAVKIDQQQQQSVFSIAGFRTNSKESATDSLFEDDKPTREREAVEKKSVAGATKSVASEKAKQYLLSTLFGSGGKVPMVPAFGAAKSSANVTKTTTTTSSESGSRTIAVVEASRDSQPLSPRDVESSAPNNSSTWTAPSYLTSSETSATSAFVSPAITTLASTSGTTPSSTTTASSSYTISNKTSVSHLDSPPILSPATATATKSLPVVVTQLNTPPTMSPIDFASVLPPPPPPPSMPPPPGSSIANRTSTNSSIMSHQPTLQLSSHIELMSNAMMSKLEELRGGIEKVSGGAGATASSLGFYDEMNETGGVIILERKEVKKDVELEDSDSSDEEALVVKGRKDGGVGVKRDIVVDTKGLGSFAATVAAAAASSVPPKDEFGVLKPHSRNGSSHTSLTGGGTSVTSTTTITATAVKSPLPSSSSSSIATTPLSPSSSSSATAPTTIRTRSSHGRMSANAASLGNSLMQSLQSSPAYQNAAQKKSDREKVIIAAAAIAETLQKMEPVVLATPTSTTPRRSLIPAADSGGVGAVRSAVGGFEALKKV
ncbi:UNVERIFIED_CONTAM: hypothetical protein HDU68_010714 [Siphonaria sp. JEL0065]|nr:hypothetical protein HDU68_010714 [Siphonaria sp. JEL0065]